ncbi:MAG: hypothetical protein NC392_06430 [Roseburia sp.]|nr:hypothetical protein [Roseburia sp.]
MKMKFIQKMLAGALAFALVAMPVMSVSATNPSGGGAGGGSGTVGTNPSTSSSSSSSTSVSASSPVAAIITTSSGGSVTTVEAVPTTSSVAGVTTTVKGVYLATSVNGSVITTSLSSIASGYGLTKGETPYARIYNMDVKKSFRAAAVIDQAASAIGATVGPYVNVELGKMSGGKFSLLSSEGATITVSFGIPASFAQAGKTFAVVCVRPGGAVSILEDTDNDPNTVTFDTTGGQGAYAIIKY